MKNIEKKAYLVAEKVTKKFVDEFGYKPIIGGSLSLIIQGYTPNKYLKGGVDFNDIDLVFEPHSYKKWCEYVESLKPTDLFKDELEQLVSESDTNSISVSNFIDNYRVEGYALDTDTFINDEYRYKESNGLLLLNPLLILQAKAGYVIKELGTDSSNNEYQLRKNKRIEKHYNDIILAVECFKYSVDTLPFNIKMVCHMDRIVNQYLKKYYVICNDGLTGDDVDILFKEFDV